MIFALCLRVGKHYKWKQRSLQISGISWTRGETSTAHLSDYILTPSLPLCLSQSSVSSMEGKTYSWALKTLKTQSRGWLTLLIAAIILNHSWVWNCFFCLFCLWVLISQCWSLRHHWEWLKSSLKVFKTRGILLCLRPVWRQELCLSTVSLTFPLSPERETRCWPKSLLNFLAKWLMVKNIWWEWVESLWFPLVLRQGYFRSSEKSKT